MSLDLSKKLGAYLATPLSSIFKMKNATEQYSVRDLRQEWMIKVKNDPHLGWNHSDGEIQAETRRLFSKEPTGYHFTIIRQQWKTWKSQTLSETHSVESGGMQAKKDMSWQGTALRVGEQVYQTAPIVHDNADVMSPSDEYAAGMMSMLLRDNKGTVEPVLNAATIDNGPLGTFMTSESYVNFTHSAAQVLKDVGARGKGDEFQRSVYRGMTQSPKEVKVVARQLVYSLFSPQKITVHPATKSITWNESKATFSAEKGVDMLKLPGEDGKPKILQVPRLLPGTLKGAAITVDKTKKERFPPAQLADYITSHFPPALVKYYGLRMACDKTQRQFMAIRPFLPHTVIIDPTPGMRRWIVTNGMEDCIKTRPTKFFEGTMEEEDIELVFHNYEKGQKPLSRTAEVSGLEMEFTDDAYFYGKVNLDRDFFTYFKIVYYQPSANGYWVYCPAQQVVRLPAEQFGMKLTVVSNQAQMLVTLTNLIRSLSTGVFRGHYMPNGKMYDGLCYPRDQKDYEIVNLSGETYVSEMPTVPGNETYQQASFTYEDDLPSGQQQGVEERPSDFVFATPAKSAKLPKLLAPTQLEWGDSAFDFVSENMGEMMNLDPLDDYKDTTLFLPNGVGAQLQGDLLAWNYAGVEYVGVYRMSAGYIVLSRVLWDEVFQKCLVAKED